MSKQTESAGKEKDVAPKKLKTAPTMKVEVIHNGVKYPKGSSVPEQHADLFLEKGWVLEGTDVELN